MTSTTNAGRASTGSRTPIYVGAGLLLALIVIGLVAGDTGSSAGGPPYAPTSTSAGGTRGLVILLDETGADLRVGQRLPSADSHVALLLHDGLDDSSRDQLRAWVSDGGTLIVADPGSPLSERANGGLVASSAQQGLCDIPELTDAGALSVQFAEELNVPADARSCFGDGQHALVVREARGQGTVVSIATADVFTNDRLDEADNSVLAVRLLLSADNSPVSILDPNPPGSGSVGLWDLVADSVFQAGLQLGVAFIVYALWRARRVGRPVTEPQPVAIAGSQFVRAVGGLQQRSRATDRAAAMMRIDTRRTVCERLGVPFTVDAITLADLIAARTGLDRARVEHAVGDTPILDEASLVTLGQQLDTIRQEVLDGRRR
jgi:Domain of unknown function (DUF4350)